MAGASITVDGSERALRQVSEAYEKIANPYEMFQELGVAMAERVIERFDDSVDPEGNPWPVSLRVMTSQGGGKTLVDKALLRNSITSNATEHDVEIGTNVIYAAIHQFGGTIRPKSAKALAFNIPGIGFVQTQAVNIPARPFLGFNDADKSEISKIAGEYLAAAFGERHAG